MEYQAAVFCLLTSDSRHKLNVNGDIRRMPLLRLHFIWLLRGLFDLSKKG